MPRETRFYECEACGKQYDNYGDAEQCEWRDEYAKDLCERCGFAFSVHTPVASCEESS